jgi:hypothetical protein
MLVEAERPSWKTYCSLLKRMVVGTRVVAGKFVKIAEFWVYFEGQADKIYLTN